MCNKQETIHLTLPYPPSANNYWRSCYRGGHVITYVSKEAKQYKEKVAEIARANSIIRPIEGLVHVSILLYPKRPKDWEERAKKNPNTWHYSVRSLDLDNCRKILYDALKGIVFGDDKWIFSDSGKRMIPDGEARVVVTVSNIMGD